ncbi:MAG: cysteine-rich KTR domain-containing protein [Ruminiclostridium sp.]|nr:cysteine-rich KTR domain-containing protein [Ruminiclostridium sp.]
MSKPDVMTDWVYCPICGNKTRSEIKKSVHFNELS